MKALLSIKPEYVEQIINGTKKFEYRKKVFKKSVESVVIYSTMPVGKIIGEFKVEQIIKDTPEKSWDETRNFSGISKEAFLEYFKGREGGYAIKIKDFEEYDNPIIPRDVYENFVAPQSYKYI